MPAAVKAARQTGGVTLLSWLSQKMMRCAVSRNEACAAGSTSSGRTVIASSNGIAAISAIASSRNMPVATLAAWGLSTSMNIADLAGSAMPWTSWSMIRLSARMPARAGAVRIARMM
jgi:hypothetical protein